MKNYSFHVGIDISKSTLDVAILDVQSPKEIVHFVVENSPIGLKKIISHFKKVDLRTVLFCCENTGVYTYPISYFMSHHGLDYAVIPPIEIKRSKGITRGKSDKTDAQDIALYSKRNIDKIQLSKLPAKEIQQLRMLTSERENILKAIHMFTLSKEPEKFVSKDVYSLVKPIKERNIKLLKESLKVVEKKMKEIILANQEINRLFQLATSVPGIGHQTAIYLIVTTNAFKAFKTWRKLACYAGIASFEYTSGSSVRGRTKVNPMADKKLKSMLQMCVLSAMRYDPQLKEYYQRKKAEGKNSMLVQNNIRCKLISRVFSVVNRNTPFVNTYKFAS